MPDKKPLPHQPYITAVVQALASAGLEPTEHWTDDSDIDPYRDDDNAGVACMLSAVLDWQGDHPALTSTHHTAGISLLWHHPAELWQWAPNDPHRNGHLAQTPEFLTGLGRYSNPDSVADTVRALLTDQPIPDGHAPYWHPVDPVRKAIDTWAADEN